MNSIVNINGFSYYKVDAIAIMQNGMKFYILGLNVQDIARVSTRKPADYNAVEDKFVEAALTDTKIQVKDLIQDNKDENFNRHLDEKKLNNILKYVKNNATPIFPNSLILAAYDKENKLINNDINPIELIGDESENFNQENGVYFYEREKKLFIPIIEKSILIVDGQHRIAALSQLPVEQQQKIELPITLVVGQDNATLSNMFYTINSTQKPVNRSVLEYMTNLFLTDITEAKMFQEYIRVLNDNKKSPLHQQIKMFGTGKGLIAFAPLHENLMNMTIEVSKRSAKIPIFRPLFLREDNQYMILNIIVFYFNALKKLFSDPNGDWNKDIVFTKTIGLVALLQVFPRIILKIIDTSHNINNEESLLEITQNDFDDKLKDLLKIDTTPYEKAGSMGLSTKLRKKIIQELTLDNYSADLAKNLEWLSIYYK